MAYSFSSFGSVLSAVVYTVTVEQWRRKSSSHGSGKAKIRKKD